MAADDAALHEQKLRAIRELMQVKQDLLSALQGREGAGGAADAAPRPLPPPPPPPPRTAAHRRVSLEDVLRSGDEARPSGGGGVGPQGFERYGSVPASAAGSPAREPGWPPRGSGEGGASVPPSPAGWEAAPGAQGAAAPRGLGALLPPPSAAASPAGAAWATQLSADNAALQRALREAQAAARAAEAAAAAARAQAEAHAAQLAAQSQQLADAARQLADANGPARERERSELASLREQVLSLQSELELERVFRARAESDAALARSTLATASQSHARARAATPAPQSQPQAAPQAALVRPDAVFGEGGVLAPDWVPSFAELPPGGHWAMAADGGIWYTHARHGAWRQAADGAFGRSSEVPPPPRRAALAAQ